MVLNHQLQNQQNEHLLKTLANDKRQVTLIKADLQLHAFSGKRLRTSSGTDDSFTNQP
jgi:hypothetical protein